MVSSPVNDAVSGRPRRLYRCTVSRSDSAAAFAALDPAAHPRLVAALAGPAPPPRPDLFDRAVRAVLIGLLTPDGTRNGPDLG